MGLLDDIIKSGVADQPPALKVVLRQCILLANELKVPLLRTWAEQELNGYPDPSTVSRLPHHERGCHGSF